ncbi:MAG: hypothetical protein ACK4HW_09075 [Roseinatronobacter sp.]
MPSVMHVAQKLRLWIFCAFVAIGLTACAAPPGEYASDAAIAAARYSNGGAPELTLVTIMNYQTGNGDHTALFINGTERVLFDPAGSWKLDGVPERNDVHFGMAPRIGASFYLSHVRPSHYAVVQRLRVTPEIAEQVKALALQVGPVPPAQCALSTSRILQQMPGMEGIRVGWYPHNLMRSFAQLPGVMTYEIHHDAPDALEQSYRVQTPL